MPLPLGDLNDGSGGLAGLDARLDLRDASIARRRDQTNIHVGPRRQKHAHRLRPPAPRGKFQHALLRQELIEVVVRDGDLRDHVQGHIGGLADRVFFFLDGRINRIETNEKRLSPSEITW